MTTAAAELIVSACEGCGAQVERELPTDMAEPWRSTLARFPARCEGCAGEDRRREQAAADERARAARLRAIVERRQLAGLPLKLRGLDLDALDPDLDTGPARAWAAGQSPGLVLLGPVGTGKTSTAAAAVWAMLARRPALWLSVPELFARLGAAFGGDLHQAALTELVGTQALALDDLDKARPSEYAAEALFTAIDGRLTHDAALLVTSNLSLSELAKRWPAPYGEAIASRLAGVCTVQTLDGPDRRLS